MTSSDDVKAEGGSQYADKDAVDALTMLARSPSRKDEAPADEKPMPAVDQYGIPLRTHWSIAPSMQQRVAADKPPAIEYEVTITAPSAGQGPDPHDAAAAAYVQQPAVMPSQMPPGNVGYQPPDHGGGGGGGGYMAQGPGAYGDSSGGPGGFQGQGAPMQPQMQAAPQGYDPRFGPARGPGPQGPPQNQPQGQAPYGPGGNYGQGPAPMNNMGGYPQQMQNMQNMQPQAQPQMQAPQMQQHNGMPGPYQNGPAPGPQVNHWMQNNGMGYGNGGNGGMCQQQQISQPMAMGGHMGAQGPPMQHAMGPAPQPPMPPHNQTFMNGPQQPYDPSQQMPMANAHHPPPPQNYGMPPQQQVPPQVMHGPMGGPSGIPRTITVNGGIGVSAPPPHHGMQPPKGMMPTTIVHAMPNGGMAQTPITARGPVVLPPASAAGPTRVYTTQPQRVRRRTCKSDKGLCDKCGSRKRGFGNGYCINKECRMRNNVGLWSGGGNRVVSTHT
mmetsp:Transcript_25985/g.87096  ORF Transcript_25985/g.87096 Transcript_25985/m.87096 type:complete len:496 (+) Transcript_25985:86-1573(+)